MKKKIMAATALFLGAASLLTACSGEAAKENNEAGVGHDKLSIVTTIFPSYDFARNIAGDNAEVTLLLPPGSESHTYEPTPQDIITIQNSDLFIYVGGESDVWVDKIVDSSDKKLNTLKLIDCVDAVEEVIVEGMESEEEHGEEAEEVEYDEHVWTSPANAAKITEKMTETLCAIDSDKKELYNSISASFIDELNELDKSFKDFWDTVDNKVMVFGDRFPLRYFADEYGVKYYAAFPGCSSESEPSAATVAFLTDKVKNENLSTVFYIEFSSMRVANSIAASTDAKTALFHSCHNVSADDMKNGASYISLMKSNLETLKQAFGK